MTTSDRTALNANIGLSNGEALKPQEVFRKDYAPLPYLVEETRLNFDLRDGKTTVVAELKIVPNSAATEASGKDFVLDGEEDSVKLFSLKVGGKDLVKGEDYELVPGKLILKEHLFAELETGDSFVSLQTEVEIVPEANTQLSGLYKSGGMYCSQCEAMGFRRITYYPDRPDIMSAFKSVRIEADKTNYPVLLSNGNLIE